MRLKQIDTEDEKLAAKHKQRLADYLILSVDDTNFTLLQGIDEKEGIEMWKTLQNKCIVIRNCLDGVRKMSVTFSLSRFKSNCSASIRRLSRWD